MNPGICLRPHAPHGFLSPIPPPYAWQDLHDLGIRAVRTDAPVLDGAKPPATIDDVWTFDFGVLDKWLEPISGAAPGGTPQPWMSIYINPGGCPPAASNGQPAYVNELGVDRWPRDSPVTLASYCGGAWWNDPDNPGLGTHDFNQDPHRTDSVTLPDGTVLTGPMLAAIDAKMPARPYLIYPPHRDPQYAYDLGRALTEYYGRRFASALYLGPENEPGGGLLARWERDMRTSGGGGHLPDLLKDYMFPEIYLPFAAGVRSVSDMPIVGCEADSADILARFLDIAEIRYRGWPSLSVCDKITIHPYGAIRNQSYSTMEAFAEVLKDRKSFRDVAIGEIDGTPEELYDFTEMVIAKYPEITDIYYLNPGRTFYGDGNSWENRGAWKRMPLSPIGEKFKVLFAKMNRMRTARY